MNTIDWGKWSAIAQVVSSVVILVTLLYLAIETRQNSAAILSNSRQESLSAELQVLRMIYDDPMTSFGQPLASGLDGLKQRAVDFSLFRLREHQWLQYQDGLLDEATMRSYMLVLVENMANTGMPCPQDWHRDSWPRWTACSPRSLAFCRGALDLYPYSTCQRLLLAVLTRSGSGRSSQADRPELSRKPTFAEPASVNLGNRCNLARKRPVIGIAELER